GRLASFCMETSLIAPHRGKETSGGLALINLHFYRASPDRLGDCPLTAHSDIRCCNAERRLGDAAWQGCGVLTVYRPGFRSYCKINMYMGRTLEPQQTKGRRSGPSQCIRTAAICAGFPGSRKSRLSAFANSSIAKGRFCLFSTLCRTNSATSRRLRSPSSPRL